MNKYFVIDRMEGITYSYRDEIEMGFALDILLSTRDILEIPYKIIYYNNGKVISIRGV
jgi:hypothetical protein